MNLWTSPASPQPAFPELDDIDPAEIERLARERLEDPEWRAELERRLKPYRTPVTMETLLTWLP